MFFALGSARPRIRQLVIGVVAATVFLGGASSFLVSRAVDQFYSPVWRSDNSNDAKRRGVFVTSPVVVPAVVAASDSVDLRVTDAWVERPTHAEYRWGLFRREVQDSAYRVVVLLTQVPHSGDASTTFTGGCFASVDLYLDGRRGGWSGDFAHHEIFQVSSSPFPDTLRLTIVRHGHIPPPAGAPARSIPDCP
jgi:hypothetical protein